MSGFEFHLRCHGCELISRAYPFRFDQTVRPTHAVLPVIDRARKCFDVALIEVSGTLAASALAALAAASSSADRTICVPHMHAEAPWLEPAVVCPRCGADAVRVVLGGPPRAVPVVESVDRIIGDSRAQEPGTARAWMLGASAQVTARRHGGPGDPHDARTCDWRIARPEGVAAAASEVVAVVAALTAALERCGSRVEPRRALRAFTDLVEQRAADEVPPR